MLKTITKNLNRFFSKSITNREALNSALDEELARDPKAFIIGE
jgi:hypothetical protein